ncbi:TlpA disulfide reductase family protein [Segatella buccae]|uniref:TlpA disulfide reductase family protein n=1 Tax=Segatella buccae TaxID=28126 RepID=UPI0022E8ADCD|nr:TlpA disulfide reductase family protein [Segatella buccae]
MKITGLLSVSALALAVLTITSCSKGKFHINGNIAEAEDSMLYLENIGLDGPVKIDSVKLEKDGSFAFSEERNDAPEFYRLRIGNQSINLSIDSTETVSVKAAAPTMWYQYEVNGSENCRKIKELALMQIDLQARVNALAAAPGMGADSTTLAIQAAIDAYKDNVKRNYIFKAPMKAYAYYALFQTINLGSTTTLIFNPRSEKDDVKVFAAVATSWDTYYPDAERGKNLHNIAIEGLKNIRIAENNRRAAAIDASKVQVTGLIDLPLTDNKGRERHLTDLKGQVVLLDFHVFASDQSPKRIMALRDLYNKYHAQGFEIYQVSLDENEHFWKTQTAALPWISVRDDRGISNVYLQATPGLPAYFLIGRDNSVAKGPSQIKNIDADIQALL